MRLRERPPALWKQRGYIGVGNRRGMGGMTFRERIAAMIENADLRSELEYTAIPQRAASGVTASFTRATTKTWKNNDGYMVTGVAGEIDFPGARRVRNLIAGSTADLNNASWSKLNGATVAVDGRTVTFTANASSCIAQSYTFVSGNKYILQFKVSVPTTSKTFRLRADAVATQNSSELTATTTPTTVSFAFTAASSGAGAVYLINNAGATAGDIIVEESQFIDVTAETDQTTPREYASVGVASAPYYHGSMIDGIKCFPTDINGVPLTTMERYKSETTEINSTIQSNSFATAPWVDVSGAIPISQNVVGPDGAVSAWTFNDNGVGGFMGRYQGYSLTSGTAAAFGIFVKKTTGAQTNYPAIVVSTPTHMSGACLHRTNGTAAAVTGFVGRTAIANTIVVEDFNTDYWRVKFTFTPNSTGVWGLYVMPAFNADGTGVGDNTITGTAVFYGMQVRVNGTIVGSYIATTTVAATRDADVLSYTGGDISNIKTLACTFQRAVGVSALGAVVGLNDNTFNNYNYCYLNSATQFKFEGYAGGVEQWKTTASNAYTPGTQFKAASSTATNSILMDLNGTAQTADTVATIPVVTRLDVGHIEGDSQLNGNVGGIYGWTRNLSQSELAAVDR